MIFLLSLLSFFFSILYKSQSDLWPLFNTEYWFKGNRLTSHVNYNYLYLCLLAIWALTWASTLVGSCTASLPSTRIRLAMRTVIKKNKQTNKQTDIAISSIIDIFVVLYHWLQTFQAHTTHVLFLKTWMTQEKVNWKTKYPQEPKTYKACFKQRGKHRRFQKMQDCLSPINEIKHIDRESFATISFLRYG